jgi:hypothetical protein
VQVVHDAADRQALHRLPGAGGHPYAYLAAVARVSAAFAAPAGSPQAAVPARRALPAAEANRALDAELKAAGAIPAWAGIQGRSLVSDTGEVRHDWGRGLITVDTARSQGFTGFPGATPVRLRDVRVELRGGRFASVVVASLDGEPIAASRRLLITAVGRAANDGMTTAYGRAASAPDGTLYGELAVFARPTGPPGQVRMEPVLTRIDLPGRAARITAIAGDLAAGGAPRLAAPSGAGRMAVDTDGSSAWYLVESDP